MRKALELICRYDFGIAIQTKSAGILRDLDILERINNKTKCVVQMTLTTYDEDLCKKLEPNVSTTKERFEVLRKMRAAGIPTVVWLSPILPFINDTEDNINGLLDMCKEAGVYGIICFGMGLTLRDGNREYFYKQLDRFFPGLKEKYIRTYGYSYEVISPEKDRLMKLFDKRCEEAGIIHDNDRIFSYLNEYEIKNRPRQMSIWDEWE